MKCTRASPLSDIWSLGVNIHFQCFHIFILEVGLNSDWFSSKVWQRDSYQGCIYTFSPPWHLSTDIWTDKIWSEHYHSKGFDQDSCSLLVLLGPGQFPLLAFTDWEYHANCEEILFYMIKKSSTSNNLHLLRGLLALLLHGLVALLAHRGGFLHDVAHLYKCKKFPQYSSSQPTFVSSFLRASPSSLVSEGPKTPS